MNRILSIVSRACGLAIVMAVVPACAQEPSSAAIEDQFSRALQPFVQTYCLACHGDEQGEGKLDLSGYTTAALVARDHRIWELVLERIEAGEMPPQDADPQPSPDQRRAAVDLLKQVRDFEARKNAGDPGPVLARRLSSAEYDYSVRDLTGVDIQPTKMFPVDPANEAGFDNTGESLMMSPALLGKYLQAARQVAQHLVLTPERITFAPHPVVTNTDRDKYCVKRIVQFYRRQPTDLADYFYAAWDYRQRNAAESLESVATQHNVSPKYLNTVWSLLTDELTDAGPVARLRRKWRELPDDAAQASVGCRQMSQFVATVRKQLVPTVEKVNVGGMHIGSQPLVLWRNRQYAANRRRLDYRKSRTQNDDAPSQGDSEFSPRESEVTQQAFERFCSVFPDAFYVSERGRDYVDESKKQMGEKGRLLSAGLHSMYGYFRDDGPLYDMILDQAAQRELDELWRDLYFVASVPQRQYVSFLWFDRTDSRFLRDPQFDFARPENKAAQSAEMIARLADVYIEKVLAQGGEGDPIDAIRFYFHEINQRIREVEHWRRMAEPRHLQDVLKFAGRAYRRRLTPTEQDDLVGYYQQLRQETGLTHEEAIQDTLVSILMSPMFCYRVDLIRDHAQRRDLTDDELASRMSYFLWSSTPDADLLSLAEAKQLTGRERLVAKTRSMLRDPRVRGLATEFGANWLDFRRFQQHNAVDRERFPEFTDELRAAMFEEPIRFFVDVVRNDRSVLEFLDADHTFVNAELAEHYQMTARLTGDGWVRVDNAREQGRGGLLAMSVFLTKNAPGLRTSPVKRGYWVVRRLLGERIPPPPPDVPELPADESKLGDVTLREALARHRDHASCAGCHQRFDSIGLAFEGYGPIGNRRTHDLGGKPIRTSATLPGGHAAEGLDDLKNYLLEQRLDEYLDNLCRKLLSYGLGRSLILSDDLLVEEMRENLVANDYRFGSMIETIVTSQQFLTKRGK